MTVASAPPRARVALDAMGGDHAPRATVDGAVRAVRAWDHEVQLVGREDVLQTELARHDLSGIADRLPVVHAPEVVAMDEHPAQAVRTKRQSSLAVGLARVREGQADAFVSAGNTGAVLATALLSLRRIEGITSERPALAAPIPTLRGTSVLLDMGANVDCRAEWLPQFALMGSLYARLAFGVDDPSVALLSIGEESGKGNALVAEATPLLQALPGIRFVGNVEGKDVPAGLVDVVVCDGFAGNVFVKGAEGVVATMTELIRRELTATLPRKLAAATLRPAFAAIRRRLSYEEYGGVPLLGVNGICIVAHGRSTPYAVQNAIRAGVRCVELRLVESIREHVAREPVAATRAEHPGS